MDTTKTDNTSRAGEIAAQIAKRMAAASGLKNLPTIAPEKPIGLTKPDCASPLPCPDCGGTGYIRLDVPVGHRLFGKPVRCGNSVHSPEITKRLAKISGMTEPDLKRRLKDIKPIDGNGEMLEAARAMVENPRGWLYIHGGPGNAKSEILIAIVNEVNAAGGQAMYVRFPDLVNWMRDAFSEKKYRDKKLAGGEQWDNYGYLERYEKIKEIKLLAIDEIDKARMTEFAEEFRFAFFDDRYIQGKHGLTATIFASQFGPGELGSEPLASRFSDGRFAVVHNLAGDARPNEKWEIE